MNPHSIYEGLEGSQWESKARTLRELAVLVGTYVEALAARCDAKAEMAAYSDDDGLLGITQKDEEQALLALLELPDGEGHATTLVNYIGDQSAAMEGMK